MLISLVANALVTIGKEAVPALLNAINEVQPAARIEIVRALAEIGDHRAIPALVSAMQSDSAVSQYWAEYGLNKLGLGMVYLKPS
jgi:HEAT repeat protein